MTLSSIINLENDTFYNYELAEDNNETKTLLKQPLTKDHIITLDRGYATIEFLKKLDKHTNFVVRLKKNLLITKNFMKEKEDSTIIKFGNTSLKLVKYYVDKTTKKIILHKYKDENDIQKEDNDTLFVLATNVTTLTIDDCINIYKLRWQIEVAFKKLKSNFKIRHICKESNINDPMKKIKFWIDMSMFMYNITTLIKNELDKCLNGNCRFSKCASFIRKRLLNMDKKTIEKIVVEIEKIGRRFQNNTKENDNANSDRPKKKEDDCHCQPSRHQRKRKLKQ